MSSVLTSERLLTIEDFEKLPPCEAPRELVRGKVLLMNPPFPWHGYVCSKVVRVIGGFVDQQDLGRSFCNDTGLITGRAPDTLRGADFLFYSYERLPRGPLPKKGYFDVPADLAVEVRSPDQPWKEILEKVAEYLNIGVTAVVVLDPQRSTATVYRAGPPEQTLNRDETLTLPDILPGFSVRFGQFFE